MTRFILKLIFIHVVMTTAQKVSLTIKHRNSVLLTCLLLFFGDLRIRGFREKGEQHSFKPLCWNVSRKLWCWCCDRTHLLSIWKTVENSFLVILLGQPHLRYLWNSSSVTYAANENRKQENTIREYSRLFSWNCGLNWAPYCLKARAKKCELAKSRF